MNWRRGGGERGATTVEFAIIGLLFFTVLFAVVEVGRVIFTWHTLSEAARRGARVAAVCPVDHTAPAQVAVFSRAGAGNESPILPGFTTANVVIDYLDSDGNPTTQFASIRFVRSRITGYQHRLMIPLFANSITAPPFETVLPRESLGVPRDGDTAQCFGAVS